MLAGRRTDSFSHCPFAGAEWQVVVDVTSSRDVTVQTVGPPQQRFARPPQKSVEASTLTDFHESFLLMQDVQPHGDNLFTLTADQVRARQGVMRQPGLGTTPKALPRLSALSCHCQDTVLV
jgi:hypothetical protein